MGRQLLALTHFLVDVNEVLKIRAPETEVSRLDHCLILEGVPDPLRQDDARTGLITVLMGVRSGQTEIVGMAAAQLHAPVAVIFVAAVAVDEYQPVTLVYLARAVTPGTYQVPQPMVESMYVPQWRATGAAEDLLIVRP